MKETTQVNFGLLIAYLLPGFVTLWGIGLFSETIRTWLASSSENAPTIGGFLYVTLAAVGAGLVVSTIRWMIVDRIHRWTGIHEPTWNFATLERNLPAFEILVGSHYRYYQFHANSFIAAAFTFSAYLFCSPAAILKYPRMIVAFLLLESLLWLGSRDTLRKYFRRAEMLMQDKS